MVVHVVVSRLFPLNSSSKASVQVPGMLPKGCGDPPASAFPPLELPLLEPPPLELPLPELPPLELPPLELPLPELPPLELPPLELPLPELPPLELAPPELLPLELAPLDAPLLDPPASTSCDDDEGVEQARVQLARRESPERVVVRRIGLLGVVRMTDRFATAKPRPPAMYFRDLRASSYGLEGHGRTCP
jgi:hypothetical protein